MTKVFFLIGLRNIFLNYRRSLAALIAIVSAFTSLILFQGYISDVEAIYVSAFSERQMLGDAILERRNLESPGKATADETGLTADEQDSLSKLLTTEFSSEVEEVVRFLTFSGLLNTGKTSLMFVGLGFDLASGKRVRTIKHYWNTIAGKPLEEVSVQSPKVLLGKGLSEALGCKWHLQNEILFNENVDKSNRNNSWNCPNRNFVSLRVSTESAQLNSIDTEISGLTSTGFPDLDEKLLLMPLGLAQKIMDTERISYLSVKFAKGIAIQEVLDRLNNELERRDIPIRGISWKDHVFGDLYTRTMEFLRIFGTFVVSIVLIIAAMIVIGTYHKIVSERIREIGAMRSLGFSIGQIELIFFFEALILALCGLFFGIICCKILIFFIETANITYMAGLINVPVALRVSPPLSAYFYFGILTTVLSLVASFLTSRTGARKVIADALGHT